MPVKPLEGLLVIALEQAVAAPFCTMRLREAGARVIKIEREEGDFARGYDRVAAGDSSYFFWLNQGKESLTLNFKQQQDADLLKKLLCQADIVVQNLAPGALSRAGFDFASLRKQHPALITCDISGYGNSRAVEGLKAYDFLVQAESGMVSISGGENEIGRIGVSACDIGAGMTAHAGILEALLERQLTGVGKSVEVSLFGVASEWMTVPLLHHDYGGAAPKRAGLNHPSIAPYGGYQTKDKEIVIIAIQNEREWQRFCTDVLLQPNQSGSEKFGSNHLRVTNRPALDEMIHQVTRSLSRDSLVERLKTAGVAYGSVNSVAAFSDHPALDRRSGISSSGETIQFPARPMGDYENYEPVPKVGEHNEKIRMEYSGVTRQK
ncbi:MAG: CoA transferase [Acidiferrobacterales bacterium]|nr:CoA transferase [Acidiferrobacterales bacterium]